MWFRGQCAELCGRNHANMTAQVRALRPAEFEAWLDRQRARHPRRQPRRAAAAPPGRRRTQTREPDRPPRSPAPDPPHGRDHTEDHHQDPADRRPRGRARAHRLDVVGDHDRPQADRDHVPGPDLRLLPAGRGRGAADAPAARPGRTTPAGPADVQRAVHDARDDDGLPVRRPDHGRLRQLLPAADDRRAGHGVPEAQRAVVLAAGRGRDRLLRLALLQPARVRLDLLPAARLDRVPARAAASTRGSSSSTSPA